jgi:hypothetical protein
VARADGEHAGNSLRRALILDGNLGKLRIRPRAPRSPRAADIDTQVVRELHRRRAESRSATLGFR